ncbi:MAG TPA: hypothetical protein VLB44_13865 [Kofleriaceae bacterium]|nr:hypothetical protein [Kofleriaceae bacterium]
MRLGTCIALELAVAAGAIGGVWLGVGHALELAGEYLTEREASAATNPPAHMMFPSRVPAASLRVEPPAAPKTVFEATDDALLGPIAAAPVTRIKLNHGGTSLSLRVEFANGSRASFKPEQIHPQSDPRKEIAAYRIDRLLGIGHVPPAKAVKFTVAELVAAADPEVRTYTAGRIAEEGTVRRLQTGELELRGEASWWIPEIRDAWIGKFRVDESEGVAQWTSYLQIGAEIPPRYKTMVEQLATLAVFDVIVDNADRWSGSNTKCSPDQKILYFMDNALSFSVFSWGHDNNLGPLRRIQKFPRGLIQRLRGLTLEMLDTTLDDTGQDAGMGPLLEPEQVAAILARRDHVIEYVDRLIAQFGEDAVLSLP